jgi:hypothetical protein
VLPSQSILPVAQLHFRALQGVAPEDVVLLAVIPGYPDQGEVELSKEIWSTMSPVVHSVTIALESGAYTQLALGQADEAADIDRRHFGCFRSEMRSSSGRSSPVFPDYLEAPVGYNTGMPPLALSSSIPPPSVRPPIAPYSRRRPQRYRPGQSDYATQMIPSVPEEAPRKPVIYLYPPSNLADVTVELLLTSSWQFSAIYPPPLPTLPPGEHQTAQSLTWAVSAEPGGTLTDKTTGTEVSYLYWEAT